MVGSFKMFLVRKINALRTASPRRTILQVMQMEGRLTPAVLGDQPLDAGMSDITQVSTLPDEGTGQTAGTTTDTVALRSGTIVPDPPRTGHIVVP